MEPMRMRIPGLKPGIRKMMDIIPFCRGKCDHYKYVRNLTGMNCTMMEVNK